MSPPLDITVEVIGEDGVRKRLAQLPDRVQQRLRPALEESGNELKDAAAAFAPHKSGKGAGSIKARLRESAAGMTEVIKPSRFYMRFQETGLDTMRNSRRIRGIIGVRQRLTKSGTVLITARRGLVRGSGTGGSHPFHLPAHPFMRPAFESLKDRIVARIRKAVDAAAQAG